MRPYILEEVKKMMNSGNMAEAKRLLVADMACHIEDMRKINHDAASYAWYPARTRATPELGNNLQHITIPSLQFNNPTVFSTLDGVYNCVGITTHTAAFTRLVKIKPEKFLFIFDKKTRFTRANRALRNKPNPYLDLIPRERVKVAELEPAHGIALAPEQTTLFHIHQLVTPIEKVDNLYIAQLNNINFFSLIAIYQLTECASYISDL